MEKCPECFGFGFSVDRDGDPCICPECVGCMVKPASADDALALVGEAA